MGDLEGPVAAVGADGTVEPLGSPWRVGWAVGAEDRWHVAAEEAAVRTRLVDDMPVVATAMKVPGGDVVLRAAAGLTAGGRAVVLEFTNASPVPVSLAVGVTGSIHSAAAKGSCLLADGRVAVDLGCAPGGTVAVDNGETWPAIRAEPPRRDCEARSRAGLASAAAVVPLVPGAPLRATVPIDGGAVAGSSPEEIAAGWRVVVERAASLDLPDEAAVRTWRRGIAASVLGAGSAEPLAAARAAAVLDRVGLPDEADRAREVLVGAAGRSRLPPPAAAAALRALASRRLRAGRVSPLADWAGPLAEAAAAGGCLDPITLEQVAAALETEEPSAARDARRLLATTTSTASISPAASSADGLAKAVRNSLAFGGDGVAGVEALLDCLVTESADRLVVLPAPSEVWNRAPVDARSLVTRHGVLSFSVRWHGPRPALLWELPAVKGQDSSGTTVCCGLDQSWQSEATAGEALLEPGTIGA
ncbi:MAG: hypothetical protein F4126_10010 [Acidimicrobiaceae bacterium]|nr:hypothetical protein [Acidimicrobiaceae bacterium]MYB87946.1 hypothetical protein [Acidimicrobiaceae bacterium]MYH94042.1 hypothetical protein [Acidimicrobiaceae bacterium]